MSTKSSRWFAGYVLPSKSANSKCCTQGADDDGLWFFNQAESRFEVQIESPDGMCPFLIETDETPERFTTNAVAGTVETLLLLLHLSKDSTSLGD